MDILHHREISYFKGHFLSCLFPWLTWLYMWWDAASGDDIYTLFLLIRVHRLFIFIHLRADSNIDARCYEFKFCTVTIVDFLLLTEGFWNNRATANFLFDEGAASYSRFFDTDLAHFLVLPMMMSRYCEYLLIVVWPCNKRGRRHFEEDFDRWRWIMRVSNTESIWERYDKYI